MSKPGAPNAPDTPDGPDAPNGREISARIDEAVAELERGALVAFPTETVYGLGADATNPEALQALYATKGRPNDHPVIVHIAESAQLDDLAINVPQWAYQLTAQFWPGPLTLVVQRRPGAVCDEVTGGRETVGVRVPDHPIARQLLERFGRAVAAPSANRFGKVSPTTAQHVITDFEDEVALVLDGGPSEVGVESTIVDATAATPVILRLGGITAEQIAEATGLAVSLATDGEVAAPGTLASHYSPQCRVETVTSGTLRERAERLTNAGQNVAVLALDDDLVDVPNACIVLSSPNSPQEYAQTLYSNLREADRLGADVLLAVPPTAEGIGAAVADRLRRAATV